MVPDFRSLLEERVDMGGLYGFSIPGLDSSFCMNTSLKVSDFRIAIHIGSINWYLELKDGFITKQEFLNRLDYLVLEMIEKDGNFVSFVKNQNPKLCLKVLKNNRKLYPCIKIVNSSSFDDCILKLENKLKLENLISQDAFNHE